MSDIIIARHYDAATRQWVSGPVPNSYYGKRDGAWHTLPDAQHLANHGFDADERVALIESTIAEEQLELTDEQKEAILNQYR